MTIWNTIYCATIAGLLGLMLSHLTGWWGIF